jgi:hypothetical protein
MKDFGLYKTQILKWACIGLFIRLILMPFTMHSQDSFFINYFPMMFANKGIWDPYGFISTHLPHYPGTYYGPVLFILMSIANFIFVKCFNAVSLVKGLELSSTMMFSRFGPFDFVHVFQSDLFKNLFLMKSPYLIFDFLTGAILLKLALSKKLALASYKLWMLNIVVLHSTYMIGQVDLIVAFFVIIALFFAVKKRPYLSIVSLALGGGAKLFPYILILPASLLLGHNWKKRLSLLFTAGIFSILTYLPFYLSSGNPVLGTFALFNRHYPGMARWILTGIFAILYVWISINAIKDSKESGCERKLLFYFLVIGFLTFAANPISFRFFVFITPLLVLVLPQHKRFAVFTLFVVLLLAFLRLTERSAQLGLFAPINPAYFSSLPSLQEIMGRFINIEMVYKVMCRVLLLCFFVAAGWVWSIKLNNDRILVTGGTE